MDSLGHHTSGADVDLVGAAFQAQLALISSNLFSTYLMALAAHHRGLPVTFVKSLPNISARWQKLADFELPKSFIVAHGHHTHSFNNTIGDRTGLTAALLAGDKNRTKLMLARARIAGVCGHFGQGTGIQESPGNDGGASRCPVCSEANRWITRQGSAYRPCRARGVRSSVDQDDTRNGAGGAGFRQ